jgi:uncharacterized membrane protein YeaQ/YmgE (transglycosylase-associated protein family)
MEELKKLDARAIAVIVGVGLIAGFITNLILGGGGILRTLIIGIIGSGVGALILGAIKVDLGIRNPIVRQIAVATIGAIVLVLIARYIG